MMFHKFDPTRYLNSFIVQIENGKIIGEENKNFYAFKGILYAKAERFSEPKRYEEKWKHPRIFQEFGDACA